MQGASPRSRRDLRDVNTETLESASLGLHRQVAMIGAEGVSTTFLRDMIADCEAELVDRLIDQGRWITRHLSSSGRSVRLIGAAS